MTTNFTPAEQQALKICQDDGVCLSPSVMLNSLELLGFKPESATVAQLGAGARALRKLQRMSHDAIAALYEKARKLNFVEPKHREQRIKVLLARQYSGLENPDEVQETYELLVRGMVAVHQHWEQIAQAKSIRDMIADNRASDVGEDDIGRLLFANIICDNTATE